MSDSNENITETELEALEAIYVHELTYSRNADGQVETIELLLHPATGHDVTKQYVCMTLVFTISSEYPHELPEIAIRNPRGLGQEEAASLVEDMILKAEEMKGEPMLYTLIEMAKDSITEGNIPHCPCVVCLEHFHQRDIFHRTACYHYFHSRCLYKYLLHAQVQLEVEEKEASERRHLDAGTSDKDKSGQILCPVCRSALDEESLMVTCSQEELEKDEKVEEFVMPADLKEQQKKMLEMYEQQKAKGGIIDLEHEKNKYLLNPDDRMPVRSQKLSPITVSDDLPTGKQGTRERNRDRHNSSNRQDSSSQQYKKDKGRGYLNFYSARACHERLSYEDRSGSRLTREDGASGRTNRPSGSGSRRVKDTDSRTEKISEIKTTSEEGRTTVKTERVRKREKRMVDEDRSSRRGHTDSSVNEVHALDGGFSRTDKRERLNDRYDNERTDGRQKVDRRQHDADRYERKGEDVYHDDHEIANQESKNIEAGIMTKADREYKSVENDRVSVSVKAYRTGSGHRREEVSEGRNTYTGESYLTQQKYYSNPSNNENVYNNDDKSNETDETSNIRRTQVPKKQSETELVNKEGQHAENESISCWCDRFGDVTEMSRDNKHGDVDNNSTESTTSVVWDEDAVAGCGVQGASAVDRLVKGGRDSDSRDRSDEHARCGRGEDERRRRGFDEGSNGYQRGSGSHRSTGSGAGSKERGSGSHRSTGSKERGKYQEGRGSYAGYSERSHGRHERPQQHHQQQQQWHRHDRHGEERERVDRTVRVVRERVDRTVRDRSTEEEVNCATTGQGVCGTDLTSEAGSKDDEEADSYCQIVRRFDYDRHSHKSSGSEMMVCDHIEDENDTSKTRKPYPLFSESELRMFYVGYDEVDQDNWDEEVDIYHYERYKIRRQRLHEYDHQAAPRKKYYQKKVKEKNELQNMIEAEERRILKERAQRGFQDDEMESQKNIHMKSILDVFKEDKAKEPATSVSKYKGAQRATLGTWIESGDNFESKVDKLYKSTKPNLGSEHMSQNYRVYGTPARVDSEIARTNTCNHQDITNWLDTQDNCHGQSQRLSRRTIVDTKGEDNHTGTWNQAGQGQYSRLSVQGKEGSRMTTSSSSWDDKCIASDICPSKCFLRNIDECKGVCYKSHGVFRIGECRDSGVSHRDDCTAIDTNGVSHKGDCMDTGDSHRQGGEHWKGDHMYHGISHRGEVPWFDHRDKGDSLTGDGIDSVFSHAICYRRGSDSSSGSYRDTGVSSRDIHRDTGVSSRDIHRDTGVSSRDIHTDTGVSSRDINRGTGISSRDIHTDTGVSSRDIHRDTGVSSRDIHTDTGVSSRDIHRGTGISSRDIHTDTGVSSRDIHRGTGISSRDIHTDTGVSSRDIHTDTGVSSRDINRGTGISSREINRGTGISSRDIHTDTGVSSRDINRGTGISSRDIHTDTGVSSRDINRGTGISSRDIHTDTGVSSRDIHTDTGVSSRDINRGTGISSRDIHRVGGFSCRDEYKDIAVPLTTADRDNGVSHKDDHRDSSVGGPLYTTEQTSTPTSFMKHFKKAPPLRFPKKNRQGASHDSPSQIPVVLPAAVREAAQDETRKASHHSFGRCNEQNCSKCFRDTCSVANRDTCSVANSQTILSESTSAMLNARPPTGFSDLSAAVLNNYLANSVLNGNLLASNQIGLGLSPSLLSLYTGNISNAYLRDLYDLTYNNNAQNVATEKSVTTNTCGVSDVRQGDCAASGGGTGGAALGKENTIINF